MCIKFLDFSYILHFKMYKSVFYMCLVQSIYRFKSGCSVYYTKFISKSHNASTAVTAHRARISICIIIHHRKILCIVVFKQNQAVCAYAKFTVTKLLYQFGIIFGKYVLTVIDHYKIVAGALVFIKRYRHSWFFKSFAKIHKANNLHLVKTELNLATRYTVTRI